MSDKKIELHVSSCKEVLKQQGFTFYLIDGHAENDQGVNEEIQVFTVLPLSEEGFYEGVLSPVKKPMAPHVEVMWNFDTDEMLAHKKTVMKQNEDAKAKKIADEKAKQAISEAARLDAEKEAGRQEAKNNAAYIDPALLEVEIYTKSEKAQMYAMGIIPKDAPHEIIQAFFAQCKARKMNPFNREIYLLERKKYNKDTRQNEISYNVIVGIDGVQSRALSTDEYEGMTPILYDGMTSSEWAKYCREANAAIMGEHGEWLKEFEMKPYNAKNDADKAKFKAIKAKLVQANVPMTIGATFTRKNPNGVKTTVPVEIFTQEFMSDTNPMYSTMPMTMLAKVLKMHGLRAIFADIFGGLYIEEEMVENMQPVNKAALALKEYDIADLSRQLEAARTLHDLNLIPRVEDPIFNEALQQKAAELQALQQ